MNSNGTKTGRGPAGGEGAGVIATVDTYRAAPPVGEDWSGPLAPRACADELPVPVLTQIPQLVTVGGVVPDFRAAAGRRSGNKRDAMIGVNLGGCAANAGAFGPANGIPTAAVAAQRKGLWSDICRHLALQKGLRLILQERDTGPAVSLVTPNGEPGRFDIHTQRMEPPTVGELTPEIRAAFGTAKAVLVGPMRPTPGTRDLLLQIPVLASRAYRALVPHRDMVADPAFALVAQRYQYVQMNADESRLVDGATNELVVNARRLSFLIGEDSECAVTNGAGRGYLWAGRWLPIDPPQVQMVDDTGCGDSFAGAYVVGRVFLGLSARAASAYAADAAATTATQVGVTRPLAYR